MNLFSSNMASVVFFVEEREVSRKKKIKKEKKRESKDDQAEFLFSIFYSFSMKIQFFKNNHLKIMVLTFAFNQNIKLF